MALTQEILCPDSCLKCQQLLRTASQPCTLPVASKFQQTVSCQSSLEHHTSAPPPPQPWHETAVPGRCSSCVLLKLAALLTSFKARASCRCGPSPWVARIAVAAAHNLAKSLSEQKLGADGPWGGWGRAFDLLDASEARAKKQRTPLAAACFGVAATLTVKGRSDSGLQIREGELVGVRWGRGAILEAVVCECADRGVRVCFEDEGHALSGASAWVETSQLQVLRAADGLPPWLQDGKYVLALNPSSEGGSWQRATILKSRRGLLEKKRKRRPEEKFRDVRLQL
eukprot:1718859-Pleurochrysis_carterae.AAC.1